ncbi:HoxN/HupN/NixA family nickel/cobalt transporter [Azospirillum sp. TSO35-2]|uniref:HoxN/HupN/NixA family nickel/cobalt transporter n=1 Tax=Azospirillum sp. TSO35-2 TaxID=716796 RepID=UPI000D621B42|nr:HoxN/HupN/NixA family nickel/cobalt transporter [Azospirillum sp. TSO35-2]PWC31318.1 nickel transporter [Azospirillum sp. TSO35-2]
MIPLSIAVRRPGLKARLVLVSAAVILLTGGGWLGACLSFGGDPALFGMALLVYGLGMRHGLDADHIAAIDNVTRKLMQEGARPVAVGFFFALGHSALVVLVAAAVGATAGSLELFRSVQVVGGYLGTGVSALFLLTMALLNILVFRSVYQAYRRLRAGGTSDEGELDRLLGGRGLLARLLRPLFGLISRSWHMAPLGVLFGLGFDTATEIAMFGLSAAQAVNGLPLATILVFPVLFAAGMLLVDTADGLLMLGAYRWATARPGRRLRYNMGVTLLSALLAGFIGGTEMLGLIGGHLGLEGGVWSLLGLLKDGSDRLGVLIVVLFAVAWAVAHGLHRSRTASTVLKGDA